VGLFDQLLDLVDALVTCVECPGAGCERLGHQEPGLGGFGACERRERPDGRLECVLGLVRFDRFAYPLVEQPLHVGDRCDERLVFVSEIVVERGA